MRSAAGTMVAINFSPQFADAVAAGRKTQTIRQTARAAAGQALQLYTGQRTKACRKLADAVCVDCTYVGLTARGVTLGDKSRFPGDIDDFARADGFEDYAAMWKWFSERYETNSFTGNIIRWQITDIVGAIAQCDRPVVDMDELVVYKDPYSGHALGAPKT
jgi:hypothetical protein